MTPLAIRAVACALEKWPAVRTLRASEDHAIVLVIFLKRRFGKCGVDLLARRAKSSHHINGREGLKWCALGVD
jgi:hypothetical protein